MDHRLVPFIAHSTLAPRPSSRCAGFTLIELMITVTILAIITGMAMPSMTALLNGNAVKTETRKIVASLMYARSEAVARGGVVTIDNVSGSWSDGWTIFVDANGAGNQAINNAIDTLLKNLPAASRNMRITNNAVVSRWISYSSTGMLVANAGGLTIDICQPDGGVDGRTITINQVGRATTTTKLDCP